jgi:inorganic pyrophosphatase/exopolyphosphatase
LDAAPYRCPATTSSSNSWRACAILLVLEVAPDDLGGGHVAHTTPHVAMMLLAAILSDTVILSSPTTTERDRVMVR